MLAEFGTERRKKSSVKQQADSQLYSGCWQVTAGSGIDWRKEIQIAKEPNSEDRNSLMYPFRNILFQQTLTSHARAR